VHEAAEIVAAFFLLSLNRSAKMNIFYIIGVVVVVIIVAGFLGLRL
jgi:hypothetical protein